MIAKEKEGISVLKNEHEVHDGEMGKAPAKMQAKCTTASEYSALKNEREVHNNTKWQTRHAKMRA